MSGPPLSSNVSAFNPSRFILLDIDLLERCLHASPLLWRCQGTQYILHTLLHGEIYYAQINPRCVHTCVTLAYNVITVIIIGACQTDEKSRAADADGVRLLDWGSKRTSDRRRVFNPCRRNHALLGDACGGQEKN
jgi:hypothetical protein